jgi:hypothetical protein
MSDVYPRYIGRFSFRDTVGVDSQRALDEMQERLREKQSNKGNARYIASFPAGDFEAEDADDEMSIFRRGDDAAGAEGRELVAKVPAGRYFIEQDDAGAHLYQLPDDEPERQPLGEEPLEAFANRDAMPVMLAAHNERMRDHYSTGPTAAEHVVHRQVAGIPSDDEQRQVLAHINRRHGQVFGDTQTKPESRPRDLTRSAAPAEAKQGLAELNKANAIFYGSKK